ncbi:Ig-like domain-containing protein, partial [Citrobacter sp. JGM124]|uniref:Ig-like domain-containing protein n=1 Tax=Citrobacter sp. JGM124 TaxID=2799789 RepID=UPI001BA679EA
DKSKVDITSSGITNTSGETTITLTSTNVAVADITVSARVGDTAIVNADRQVSFIANIATAHVVSVALQGTDVSKIANATNNFAYTVTVKDSNGNPVPGATVTPTADKSAVDTASSGITNASGETTITLTSTNVAVADITVMARVGDTARVNADKKVSFIADSASAKVTSVKLQGSDVSKIADGISSFTYTVTVKDSNDNPVPGATVTATANKSGLPEIPNGVTNASGEATITLTSTNVAVADITVMARVGDTASVNADRQVSFIADIATALIKSVNIEMNDVKANGEDTNKVIITVEDKQGNVVPNAQVTITVPTTAGYSTVPANDTTDANGQLTVSITNTNAGSEDYTFSINESSKTTVLTFKADSETAELKSTDFTIVTNNSIADGKAENKVQAIVKDAQGNLVPDVSVVFSANNSAAPATQTITTNASGQAIFTLTNTKAGNTQVQAYLGSQPTTTAVSLNLLFAAGAPVVGTSSIETNQSAYVVKTDMLVTVTLKDAQGNIVTGKVSALTDSVVDVANATTKANSNWIENSNGTYSRTYTANTVGTGLKASLQLTDWGTATESPIYSIDADAASAVITASVLSNGKKLTPADGATSYDILITVKDQYGNTVPSYELTLTSPVLTEARKISTSSDGTVTTAVSSSIAGSNNVTIASTMNSSVAEASVTLKFSLATVNIVTPSL